jgi:hypothetical protein
MGNIIIVINQARIRIESKTGRMDNSANVLAIT